MKSLPAVTEVNPPAGPRLFAFEGTEGIIKEIKDWSGRYYEGKQSSCLSETLHRWCNQNGGFATVGDLWDVCREVGLCGAADNFFPEFFEKYRKTLKDTGVLIV